jgi:hypothetical protein
MREITLATVCTRTSHSAKKCHIAKVLAVTERVKAFDGHNITCPFCLIGAGK